MGIHENLIQSFENFKNKFLKASDGLVFKFTKDAATGKYGYKDANGNFVPFKTTHTLTRTVSSGTSAQTVDMGEDHEYRYISVSAISPQRSAGTAATTSGTDSSGPYVYFPYGWYPNHNTTYGCFVRMTAAQAQAAHSHTATTGQRTVNGTWDIGEKHNYRYINVNVTPTVWIGSTDTPIDTISQTVCTINSPHANSILKAAIVWNESFNPSSNNSYVQVKNPSGTVLYTYKPPASNCNLKVSQISLTLAATGNHTIYAYSNSSDGYIKVAMAVVY